MWIRLKVEKRKRRLHTLHITFVSMTHDTLHRELALGFCILLRILTL